MKSCPYFTQQSVPADLLGQGAFHQHKQIILSISVLHQRLQRANSICSRYVFHFPSFIYLFIFGE